MTSRLFATTLLALAAASTTACRGGSSSSVDAKPGTVIDSSSNPDDTTIYDIQDPTNKVAIGAAVTVRGVVVTAIDTFGVKTGGFWVEEPGGGPYSGVLVFGATTTDVAALAVGDLVDITGATKDEFALPADTSIRKTTELVKPTGGAITVTKTGTGTPLQPADVDALAIAQLATQDLRDAEWEKWEGVLIKVQNVSANGAPSVINSTTNPDPTFQKFPITGGAYVESSLAAMPTPAIAKGDCLGSVTGIGDYFFDWLLLPTSTANIVGGGTACPMAETLCKDGKDNDGNGFADCADLNCQATEPSCLTAGTVVGVNGGTSTGGVILDGVYVTGVTFNKSNLWVQDALQAAPNNGIFVFRGNSTVPDVDPTVVPGAKVKITGTVYSFMGLNEIKNPTIVVQAPPATLPKPITGSTVAQMTDVATAAPFVGALVTVTQVKVTTAADANHRYVVTQGTSTIAVDDDIYRMDPALNSCLTITGIVYLNTFDTPPTRVILPTQASDVATATGCP
jgi:predicted extracellular nuclease